MPENKHDAVIIGAGLGGLVCGCLLAKSGMKVLIVEQNRVPGGYCGSFKRKDFIFDIGIHSLGSCRNGGLIGSVLNTLELYKKVTIKRHNPSETIIAENRVVSITTDMKQTIYNFQQVFPREKKNIKNFINYINTLNLDKNVKRLIDVYRKFSNKSFRGVLDSYFVDENLKSLMTILLGNLGLASTNAAAISSLILFKEFIFDGGYYPERGMQSFSNALADRFKEMGGVLHCSEKANKILIKNHKAQGILTNLGNKYQATYIVSAIDVRNTYFNLVDRDYSNRSFLDKITKLEPSMSLFIVYLGLKGKIITKGIPGSNIWYFYDQQYDETLIKLRNKKDLYFSSGLFCSIPTRRDPKLAPEKSDIVCLIVGARYSDGELWKRVKHKVRDQIIKRFEKLSPNISEKIVVQDTATPFTLHKYTSNYNGAMHGWASTPQQTNNYLIRPKSYIKNLYMTGHWITHLAPGGTPMAVLSGKNTANLILADKK